jgi:hypothetical protein
VHGHQLARLEKELLRAAGQLDEIGHTAWLAADLDDVAALNGGRRNLDAGSHHKSGRHAPHRVAFLDVPWHGQPHAS